ncbi:MAG: hypothetical protein OSJ66_00475 [Clostridia bacterium]|nr:hypothetical protein [Clostridia bacterium]
MYLILLRNVDFYMGGDFVFVSSSELEEELKAYNGYILGVYNMSNKKDLKNKLLKKYNISGNDDRFRYY